MGEELDKKHAAVLYGWGVTREETEQYKQYIEVFPSARIWTGLQAKVTQDKVVWGRMGNAQKSYSR